MNNIRIIFKVLLWHVVGLLTLPLYWLGELIPKRNDVWIFGEYSGRKYADSPKALFDYIRDEIPKMSPIWLTRSRVVKKVVRSGGGRAFHVWSPQGIYYSMRASVAVCCVDHSSDLNSFVITPKTYCVNLWHGTPLKKIGADIKGSFAPKKLQIPLKSVLKFLADRILPVRKHEADLVISASPEVSRTFGSAFGIGDDKIHIAGYARNDALFKAQKHNSEHPYKIIYMPTFRNQVGSDIDFFAPYGFNISEFEEFLHKHNAEFWIRLHHYNKPTGELLRQIDKSAYIHFHAKDGIYEELNQFDILVTDVSSIYFDFLLLDRPIVFTPFDLEQYIEHDRELYYEYNDVTPGPKAFDWHIALNYFERFMAEPDWYKQERNRVRDKFNTFIDGHSSERVHSEIMNRLKKTKREHD